MFPTTGFRQLVSLSVVLAAVAARADEPRAPETRGNPGSSTGSDRTERRLPPIRATVPGEAGTAEKSKSKKALPGGAEVLEDLQRSIAVRTMGGRQFWGDVSFFQEYRIQRNVFTGHYRLLDAEDQRQAWGSLDDCRKRLEEIRIERKLPPMKGKAVIAIHGVLRSSKSFAPMLDSLKKSGYQVFGFDYPSTQVQIPEAAEYLHSCIQSLEGVEEINLVVHSMGGLVVRSYLGLHHDDRIHRMVMLGVPNRGAEMADLMKRNLLFRMIYGPAGQQLVTDPKGLIASLPTPEFDFAVIAGGRGDDRGFNPLIEGDDDGTVRVVSTRLPGAADFVLVRCLHSFLMRDPSVAEMTIRFLNDGKLRAEGDCQPIAAAVPVAVP
jgi:pimeloyl-ACP methyl ester carboxylesterase